MLSNVDMGGHLKRAHPIFMKISFCTTCKDRLFHLKQTLPISIINSSDYPDREFVILDYNSGDGLYDWAKEHLGYWEKSGVVKFLRTNSPKYFHAARAKNIAHKNASGEVLCNLDCDNIIAEGFCQYVSHVFQNKDIILTSGSKDMFNNEGCCGKIAVAKEVFYSVNGYDESDVTKNGWGWDDVNFRYRAEKHNSLRRIYCEPQYNLALHHGNEVRVRNFLDKDLLKTSHLSAQAVLEIEARREYIANIGVEWGTINDLKIGLFS